MERPKNITDQQWQTAVEIYNSAKRQGDKYPELTVAQAALETGWFKKPSGKNNYFGQKATAKQSGTVLRTTEVAGNKAYKTNDKFRDYNTIDEAVSDRIKKWGSKYQDAGNVEEAISRIWKYDSKKGQGVGYATDPEYGNKVKSILGTLGTAGLSSESNQTQEQPQAGYVGMLPNGLPDVYGQPYVAEEKVKEEETAEAPKRTDNANKLGFVADYEELSKQYEQQLQAQQKPILQQEIVEGVQYQPIQQEFKEGGYFFQKGGTWEKQQARMKAEKDAKLKALLAQEKPVYKKKTVDEKLAEKRAQENTKTVQKDNTNVRGYNNAEKFSKEARNKTDKEVAEERQARIDAQAKANEQPFDWSNFRQSLADRSQATGDALRVSNEPNFFDDYLNPAVMIGSMADNLGQAPLRAQQEDSFMPYVTAVGTPLAVGAMAGIGTQNTGQFVNNLANPLAGTGDLVSSSYNKGINYLENKGIRFSAPEEIRQGLRTNGITTAPRFKSEIDWAKWNKEIPDNNELMQEYNAIEQQAKTDGTWMKNTDGSSFQGTPEQFVQQNSENFKKAFGNTKFKDEKGNPMILHHGHLTDKDFSSFLPPSKTGISSSGYEGNYSFFTPHKELAEDYAGIGMVEDIPGYKSHVKSVYINSENPLLEKRTEFVDTDIPKSVLDKHDSVVASLNPKEFSEVAVPYGNNVKSATGNNGMFNMSNRNIYKSVAPIVGASYLATQETPTYQQGGKKDTEWLQNWYTNRVIPNKDIQNLYEEDKDFYTQRLQSPPTTIKTDSIDNTPQITGRYDGKNILMTPNASDNVYLHELTHYSDDFPSAMRTVHGEIVRQNVVPKEYTQGIYSEKYEYFTDPDEVHARIQVLRKKAGIKPDQNVTPEVLDNFLKGYKGEDENINDLLNIADPPHLLEMLNYMASNKPKNKKVWTAQLGGIKIDPQGYWNPDNEGKPVIIPSPSISMKSINYPIYGKSLETGEVKLMTPNNEYFFANTKNVLETPIYEKK